MNRVTFTLTSSLVLLASMNLAPQAVQAQENLELLLTQNSPTLMAQRIETPYTLGAGDRVGVTVFNVPEYSGEYQVLVDGTLNLPIVGVVPVRDLNIAQATELISRLYSPFLRRPLVTVSLLSPRPIRIAIAGEVNRPGSYRVGEGESGSFPTITNAVEMAGGITRSAGVRQVQLRRSVQGRQQVYNINLWDLLQNGNSGEDVTLRDGDSIFIPQTAQIDPIETRTLSEASFAGEEGPIQVSVIGEVNRPGVHTLQQGSVERAAGEGLTGQGSKRVTGAIASAGGITPSADVRNVELRRTTRDGTQQTLTVNLWELLQSGNARQDVILQEGDIIAVPVASEINPSEVGDIASATFSPETIKVNVVGEVDQPGATVVPPNTPLNQVLLAAGSFDNRRANKQVVDLVRLNSDGTVTKREIELDFTRGINEEGNPALRNNDVIVVRRSGVTRVADTLGTIFSPITGLLSVFRLFGF